MSSNDEDVNTTMNNQLFDKIIAWNSLLNEYNKEKRILVSEDPLPWWRENKKLKTLYSIPRPYLSCSLGSVASEQLFSGPSQIYHPLRNRLDAEKAAKLLFVKYNLLLLESRKMIKNW